eukprot:366167-Chlamydomonas_euryale.AAC.7
MAPAVASKGRRRLPPSYRGNDTQASPLPPPSLDPARQDPLLRPFQSCSRDLCDGIQPPEVRGRSSHLVPTAPLAKGEAPHPPFPSLPPSPSPSPLRFNTVPQARRAAVACGARRVLLVGGAPRQLGAPRQSAAQCSCAAPQHRSTGLPPPIRGHRDQAAYAASEGTTAVATASICGSILRFDRNASEGEPAELA